MKSEIRFRAPWAIAVTVVTVCVTTLLVGMALFGLLASGTSVSMVLLPMAVLLGTLPFMVCGYVLRDDELLIERFGWGIHVPLREVESAVADPEAIRGSIRLCGSGGLFGFFGWFRNSKLGVYRAYGTDPKLCVVVKLNNRTIVVTPDDPQRFVFEVEAMLPRDR
jgi:hypothetical protein